MEHDDKLDVVFSLQRKLMDELIKIDKSIWWPVDISTRDGQKLCREITLRATEELHEALQHVKLWREHKHVEDYEFDHDAFLEEIVDTLHYIVELLIIVDIGAEELYQAFRKKHLVNLDRVLDKASRLNADVSLDEGDDVDDA